MCAYGRTIKLNPFLVLLAILVGIELAGFVGALLALPIAGIIQIVVFDVLETSGHPAARVSDAPEKSDAGS